jgi:hypothetical protein
MSVTKFIILNPLIDITFVPQKIRLYVPNQQMAQTVFRCDMNYSVL